jgi:signal peptidase I
VSPRLNRRLALAALLAAAAVVVIRLSTLQGFVGTVRIEGGSMAETLLGDHVTIECSQCRRQWQCDAAQWQAINRHVCPQCQAAVDSKATVDERRGDRVVIDRAAWLWASPQRMEVVAFTPPQQPDTTPGASPDAAEHAVKRIVALPGERWQIRGGDLFIDGQRFRKSYRQFREIAQLVAEESHAIPAAMTRWRPASDNAGWVQSQGWTWRPGDPGEPGNDRLLFHPAATHPAATSPAVITDYDPYNPALPRELNEVVDVMARIECEGEAFSLRLGIHDGYQEHHFVYHHAEWEAEAWSGEKLLGRTVVPRAGKGSTAIAWGVCDRQLWLVVEDRVVISHTLEERSDRPQASSEPLWISAEGNSEMRITSLDVFRDIYYLDPQGLGRDWQTDRPLGSNEYALLGDNQPVSIDSRHWDEPIQRHHFVGRVERR